MPQNVEIKARINRSKFEQIESLAAGMATAGPIHLTQTDTFFETHRGRLKIREFGDQTAELIFYERPDCEGPKTSSYIRSTCEPSVKNALAAAYAVSGVVEKRRVVYLIDQTRVHLDQVAGLGTYLELEVVIEDDQAPAVGDAIAQQLMKDLGIEESDLVSGAYVDLLAKS
ncbi:MAG: putative adenylyl cyclase CyaB [Mariniblastus sp.]|jgi:predicted adenylyl cyclase CyaB